MLVFVLENKIITALICCEPETLSANDSSCKERWSAYSKSPIDETVCILGDLVDRELVSTIVWAKQIPGFPDLILNDQMRLLQNSWAEVLSITLAYRFVFRVLLASKKLFLVLLLYGMPF